MFLILEELRSDVKTLKGMVSNVIRRQAIDAEDTRVLPEDVVFPITRIVDLQQLERKLSDVDTFKSVVSILVFLFNLHL